MEGYLIAALVAIIIAIGGWQWRLNSTVTKKADADSVSQKHHDLRNEVNSRILTLDADVAKVKVDLYREFLTKSEHDKTIERINERFDTQDEKLDKLLVETTKVSAVLQKALP